MKSFPPEATSKQVRAYRIYDVALWRYWSRSNIEPTFVTEVGAVTPEDAVHKALLRAGWRYAGYVAAASQDHAVVYRASDVWRQERAA